MPETLELASLTVNDFLPHVQSKFNLALPNPPILELILIKAQEMSGENFGNRRAFSLQFTGPREQILPQQIYSLHHEFLGNLDIFLVPIGLTPEHCQYEAIFT